jgi:hypothetical protein
MSSLATGAALAAIATAAISLADLNGRATRISGG